MPDFQANWIPVFISSVQWQPYLMELLIQTYKQPHEITILPFNTVRLTLILETAGSNITENTFG